MHHYIVCSHMLIYQASTPLRSNSCGIHMNQNNCSNDFLSEYHQLILPRPKTCRKKTQNARRQENSSSSQKVHHQWRLQWFMSPNHAESNRNKAILQQSRHHSTSLASIATDSVLPLYEFICITAYSHACIHMAHLYTPETHILAQETLFRCSVCESSSFVLPVDLFVDASHPSTASHTLLMMISSRLNTTFCHWHTRVPVCADLYKSLL